MVPSPCVALTLSLSHGAWDRVRATQGNDERDYEKEAEPSLTAQPLYLFYTSNDLTRPRRRGGLQA